MVVWVTGAASGIGAVVAATDVNAAGLRALGQTLQAISPRSQTWALDVWDAAAIATTVEEIVKAYGRLDALVACAGVLSLTPALETTLAEWMRSTRSICGVCSSAARPSNGRPSE